MNDIFNNIIECSSLGFQINCANLNTKANSEQENANNEHQRNAQQERRPQRNIENVKYTEKSRQKMKSNYTEYSESRKQNQNQKSNYQDGVTTFTGAVLGGAGTFAAAAAGWWIAAGLAIGAGGGWAFSKEFHGFLVVTGFK